MPTSLSFYIKIQIVKVKSRGDAVRLHYVFKDMIIFEHICINGFNDDHMEHMDYLSHREDILAVLLKHKVNGDITFTCSEGDWAGENWGYRFTNGSMKKLVGKIIFVEEDEDEDE